MLQRLLCTSLIRSCFEGLAHLCRRRVNSHHRHGAAQIDANSRCDLHDRAPEEQVKSLRQTLTPSQLRRQQRKRQKEATRLNRWCLYDRTYQCAAKARRAAEAAEAPDAYKIDILNQCELW